MVKPNIPPTNYLTIRRDSTSIREAVVIDPCLKLPASVLEDVEFSNSSDEWKAKGKAKAKASDAVMDAEQVSQVELDNIVEPESGVGRRNLSVECKSGNINLDVWLVREADAYRDTLVEAESGAEQADDTLLRRAELDIASKSGSITLRLVSVPPSPNVYST